ncbi:MAG: hypothetical protein J6D02_04890 [Lachnospira sp.]|nr:hypothetical protein [Lachnospira sp.]
MSECIICKGHKPNNFKFGIAAIELDDFLREQASKYGVILMRFGQLVLKKKI